MFKELEFFTYIFSIKELFYNGSNPLEDEDSILPRYDYLPIAQITAMQNKRSGNGFIFTMSTMTE